MRNYQLRQELVLTAARHDAAFAYQLLAATKPPANLQAYCRRAWTTCATGSDDNLEQTLLGRVAALDPKLAAQNAEQMLEKGQFPNTLTEVINQLYKQDPEAADKLADKTVKKIQAANISDQNRCHWTRANAAAGWTTSRRRATTASANTNTTYRHGQPVLGQSAYVDLLSTVVDAALKAHSVC